MKISNVRIEKEGSRVFLKADCKLRPVGVDTVYFSFDEKYSDFLYADASPFAAGLLIPAMYLAEPLVIEGSVSKQLLYGMESIMDTMSAWGIGLSRIPMHVAETAHDSVAPAGIATFFSGGVDSFYTYLKHQHDADAPKYFVLIRGSDIELSNTALWEATSENIGAIARESGVEVIEVETNLNSLLEPMLSPDLTHGGSLAAVALCLRGGLKKMYMPSSFGGAEPTLPYGSHPSLDMHWGTESLSFVLDGVEATRLSKIEREVANSPIAMRYLRVCYMNTRGYYNCGRCEKCFRTMVGLAAVDKLKSAKTFPQEFDYARLESLLARQGFFGIIGFWEPLYELQARNLNPKLQLAIGRAIIHSNNSAYDVVDYLFKKWMYLDHRYLRGVMFRLYRMVR